MIYNRMKANFEKFLLDDAVLLNEQMPENGVEHMTEIIDNHYSALIDTITLMQEQTKLDVLKDSIIASYPDGITVKLLSEKLAEYIISNKFNDNKFIKLINNGIKKYFAENGICVRVYEDEQIVINFTTLDDEDEKEDIIINLADAIENKYTYSMPTLVEGAIAALLYQTFQK